MTFALLPDAGYARQRPVPISGANYDHEFLQWGRPGFLWAADGSLAAKDWHIGEIGAAQGNPTVANRPHLGQTIKFDGTNDGYEFSAGGSVNKPTLPTSHLFLFVGEFTSVAGAQRLLSTSSPTANGTRFAITAGGTLEISSTGIAQQSTGPTLSANIPYAIACSLTGASSTIYVVRRLDNGAMSVSTAAAGTIAAASDSIYTLGCMRVANTSGFQGYGAMAAMITSPRGVVVGEAALRAWTRAPWSLFCYRSQGANLYVTPAAGGGSPAIFAPRRALLGVGR